MCHRSRISVGRRLCLSYKVPVIIVLVLILVLNVCHSNDLVLVLVWTQNKVNVLVLVLVQDDFISTSMDSSWCWLGLDAGDCIPFLYIEFYIIRVKHMQEYF